MNTNTLTLNPETCWQAVQDNDHTFDGQFIVAVRTTGIYCRPSCKARLPLRKNVDFYPVAAAARAAGYRACKRCHPDAVDPVDEQTQQIEQLCRYIDAHLDEALTLEQLSGVAHWSPYHLQRTFKRVMGISPRQYVDARRASHFKQALHATDNVLQASFEAGYTSASRAYAHADTYLGMTPTEYQRGGEQVAIGYDLAECDLGILLVARTERGICSIRMGADARELIRDLHEEFPQAEMMHNTDGLRPALEQVVAYLNGDLPSFDLPLDLRVTAFQQRVLEELQRIPYGETRTYGEIAAAIGQPKAARAVGRACGTNPVPLVIPCHRVVGSNGKLTGYRYGTERKRTLLDMEAANRSQA